MKMAPRSLLVLHGDQELHRRLRSGARPHYVYRAAEDWASLKEAIRDAPPSSLVVVDPYAGTTPVLAPELYALLSEFPSAQVIAAFSITPERRQDVVTMAGLGVLDVIATGHDDTPEALGIRFRAVSGRRLKALLDEVLPEGLDGRVRALMDAAAEIVSAGENSGQLAKRLGLSRRTLLRWSQDARVPPPRRLLAWMRILLAAHLLDDRGRTVHSVASACGYSSDSSLRRVTMRFVARTPGGMRRTGAFAAASKAFLAEFDDYRSGRRGGGA